MMATARKPSDEPERGRRTTEQAQAERAYNARWQNSTPTVSYGYYADTYIPRVVITVWRDGRRVHVSEPNREQARVYLLARLPHKLAAAQAELDKLQAEHPALNVAAETAVAKWIEHYSALIARYERLLREWSDAS